MAQTSVTTLSFSGTEYRVLSNPMIATEREGGREGGRREEGEGWREGEEREEREGWREGGREGEEGRGREKR